MFLQKFYNTCCHHIIFIIVEVSVSYKSNKKQAKSTIFLQQIIGGKLLLVD